MITKCHTEKVAVTLTCNLVSVLINAGGELDHLIESPLVVLYEIGKVVITVIVGESLIIEHTVHIVKHVGGDITGYEVESSVHGELFLNILRPPGLGKVESFVKIERLKKTYDEALCCGSGIRSDDVIAYGGVTGCVLERFRICNDTCPTLVGIELGEYEVYAEKLLCIEVSLINSVDNGVTRSVLGSNVKLGIGGCPASDVDLSIIIVELGKSVSFLFCLGFGLGGSIFGCRGSIIFGRRGLALG
jgi:hypothetical protein